MFLLKKGKAFKFSPITKESFKYLKKYFAIKSIFYKAKSILLYKKGVVATLNFLKTNYYVL